MIMKKCIQIHSTSSLVMLVTLFGSFAVEGRHRNIQDTKYCNLGGWNYKQGDIIKNPTGENCTERQCNNGIWDIIDKGCHYNGRCYNESDLVDINCTFYKCTRHPHQKRFTLEENTISCCRWDRDYPHGHLDPGGDICNIYICDSGVWSPIKQGCQYNDTCYNLSTILNFNDTLYKCTMNMRLFIATFEKYSNTECRWEGKEYQHWKLHRHSTDEKCGKWRCEYGSWKLNERECYFNGTCYPLGITYFNRSSTVSCSSIRRGDLLPYQAVLKPSDCLWEGKHYPYWELHRHFMDQKCGKWRCTYGSWKLKEMECYFNGSCYPLGDTPFNTSSAVSCSSSRRGDVLPYQAVLKTSDCRWEGKDYPNWAIHRHSMHEKCGKWQCKNGCWKLYKRECYLNGVCYPLGVTPFNTVSVVRCSSRRRGYLLPYQAALTTSDCRWEGKDYKNWAIHRHPMDQKCIKWQCKYGSWKIYRRECYLNGTCYPLGDTPFETCSVVSCSYLTRGNIMPYQAVVNATGCCIYDGVTHNHGDLFTPPGVSTCVKYRCSNGVSKLEEEGCSFNNKCVAPGDSREHKCNIYICKKTNGTINSYNMSLTRTRCTDAFGQCQNHGATALATWTQEGVVMGWRCTCLTYSNGTSTIDCNQPKPAFCKRYVPRFE